MPLQLKPLYIRGKNSPDEVFYSLMTSWLNISLYQVPLPLIPIIGNLFSKKWLEVSKN